MQLYLALVLFLSSPLQGPETVDVGKSAIVKVPRTAAGETFDWLVEPAGINWISGENRNETFVILLDLDPGRYVVSFVSFDQKQHATHVIQVGNDPPSPGPGPAPPPPDPVPVPLPDGKYKLANAAAAWVASSVDPAAKVQAKALAGSFRGIAAAIAAGTLSDPQKILTETRTSNNAALGSFVEQWKPWGGKLSAELERLSTEGSLRTADDYRTAWQEIATGLEAVK